MSLNENKNLNDTQTLVSETTDSANEQLPKKKKSKFKSFMTSRKAKRGSIAVLLTLIFVAAVVVLNIICTLLVNRFPALSADLTSNSAFEIKQETKDYLETVDKDITITLFTEKNDISSKGQYYVQAEKLLKQIEQYGKNVTLKYLDLSTNPTFTQQYPNVNWSGSKYFALVECGDKYVCLGEDDVFTYNEQYLQYYGEYYIEGQNVEQGVLTAILNVTSEKTVKVGVIGDVDAEKCDDFTKLLTNNAYTVEDVSLLNGSVSDDYQFLILFAPKADLTEASVEALNTWLSNNKDSSKALIYVPMDRMEAKTPNLDTFLEEWDIAVDSSYIFEQNTQYSVYSQVPQVTSVFDYSEKDTTYQTGLKSTDVRVFMPYCMSISILDENNVQPLLVSSESACLRPFDADSSWTAEDQKMAVQNGAVVSSRAGEKYSSNVFVFGSYDAFASSTLSQTSFNNSAYFVNIFNTLAQRENAGITIEGNNIENPELGITSTAQIVTFGVIFLGMIPLLILIIGLVVWIIRRNR